MKTLEAHWEKVYATKSLPEVSWYQPKPSTSLALIEEFAAGLPRPIELIDVGGGDAFLVDNLLASGGFHPTVLDISEKALDRAKTRLGAQAEHAQWVASNVLAFTPTLGAYHIWHDRAAFHFLTNPVDIQQYASLAARALKPGGYIILGTFALNGPESCSGLPVTRYDAPKMAAVFAEHFQLRHTTTETHPTPFGTTQAFVFSVFQKVPIEA